MLAGGKLKTVRTIFTLEIIVSGNAAILEMQQFWKYLPTISSKISLGSMIFAEMPATYIEKSLIHNI